MKAINALMAEVGELPEWALQVRDAMPKWGFEMCGHRWLDGLDDVMRMIGREEYVPSSAGHCGDVPGRIVDAAGRRATAVGRWLDGKAPSEDDLDRQVAWWLGEPTAEKREAAACYVELVRAYFLGSDDERERLSANWRARAGENDASSVET